MTLRQKAQKALWFFIAIFAATSAAQGYNARNAQDPWARQQDLFKAPFDPFRDIQEIERRMDEQFHAPDRLLFGQPWDGRLMERLEMPAVSAHTKETGEEVVVELSVPGLDKDSLNISVNDSGIRVACDARMVQDKTDGSGREVFRGESERHFEQVFPIPDDADGRRSRIERKGDVVKIIFPRLEPAVKADA